MSAPLAGAPLLQSEVLAMFLNRTLAARITVTLMAFLTVALTAIGSTLFISWRLEGVAAAINDTGSLRMRAYDLAHYLARAELQAREASVFANDLQQRINDFDRVLSDLRTGDPSRPLFVPGDDDIPAAVERMITNWAQYIRPHLLALIAIPQTSELHHQAEAFDIHIKNYVTQVNELVLRMERSYARNTNILRASQVLLILMAVLGTFGLLRFFFLTIIRPVSELHEGVKRMGQGDFNVRVPVRTSDEFGELSDGFNRMATHLQSVYDTLEERVAIKTRSLETKNRELEILYDIAALLREPNEIATLCADFLQRVQKTLGATASCVRLLDLDSCKLCMLTHHGLSEDFLTCENTLPLGECLCGEIAQGDGHSLALNVSEVQPALAHNTCVRSGFHTVSATSITANKRILGIFNLFFATPHPMEEADLQLLGILGQQLGIAIEVQRLNARERELAVSEERNLIARELHDSIAQSLAFLNLQVGMLERALTDKNTGAINDILVMLRQGVQESTNDVRELLTHFRSRIEQQNLEAAIASALHKLSRQIDIATDFQALGDGAPLDPETETQAFYIIQEALSNIRKHAQPTTVAVKLFRSRHGLTLTVCDDGIGFTTRNEDDSVPGHHVGLPIMHERAARIGGQLTIQSTPEQGTEVRLQLSRTRKMETP